MADLDPREQAWLDRALVDFRLFSSSLRIRIKDERDESESDGMLGPFIWRPAQEVVWAWMCLQMARGEPIDLVILKARQFGISTFFCAWLFWQLWRKIGVRSMVAVKQKGTTMNALMETMDRFYQSLPDGFRPRLRSAGASRISKDELYFDDRKSGGYFVAAEIKDSARGDAFDHAFCTEVGSYTRAPDFFGEFVPAMGNRRNTTLVLESTAAPGYLRTRYLRAKDRNKAIFLDWACAPELYSRKLYLDTKGGRRIKRDVLTDEIVRITAADRKEMAFLSKQHEQINALCGREILMPVTEEQIWWWHWYCDNKMDGDEDFMRQEFPRDDISAFERGVVSAFRACLPIVRKTVEEGAEECVDATGTIQCDTDLTDARIEEHETKFVETQKVTKGWQEREPGIIIYRYPEKGMIYTIGVDVADDVATAVDQDDANFSVICVYCCNTREQVAEWRGSMDPHELGDEVAKVGYFYNTAIVCIEYNNMGRTTIDRFSKYLDYPNRFRWPIMDEVGKLHSKKEMWVTDVNTKQEMIGVFRYAVKTGQFIVRSPGLYEEMMGYQNFGGRYEAGPDTFADRIIAAALAWQCVTTDQAGEGLQSIVLAGQLNEKPRDPAAGLARKYVTNTTRDPFSPVPRRLPAEFDDLRTQHIEEQAEDWLFGGMESLV